MMQPTAITMANGLSEVWPLLVTVMVLIGIWAP